MMMMMMM